MRPFATVVVLGLSLAACTAPTSPSIETPEVGLAGIITDVNRQPVAGAFVTARDSAAAMSVTGCTDRDGSHLLPIATASSIRVHTIGLTEVRAEAGPLVRDHDDWARNAGWKPAFAEADSRCPITALGREETATADWLMQYLGAPGNPLPMLTPPPLELATERAVSTEYDVPAIDPKVCPSSLLIDT